MNCSAPDDVTAAIPRRGGRTGKPVVAYPNSGEAWDAAGRRWTGSPAVDALPAGAWVADGARLIGGCCRVGPGHIATWPPAPPR